ncbi:hypothetical protein PMIN03_004257 [Paraphaeosphaeria minitans]
MNDLDGSIQLYHIRVSTQKFPSSSAQLGIPDRRRPRSSLHITTFQGNFSASTTISLIGPDPQCRPPISSPGAEKNT